MQVRPRSRPRSRTSAALGPRGPRACAAWGSTSDPTTWPPRCSRRWPGWGRCPTRGRRWASGCRASRPPATPTCGACTRARGGARPRRPGDSQRRPDLALRRARERDGAVAAAGTGTVVLGPARRGLREGGRLGIAPGGRRQRLRHRARRARRRAAHADGRHGSAALLEAAVRRFGPLPGLPQRHLRGAALPTARWQLRHRRGRHGAGGDERRWPSSTMPRRSWRAAPVPPWRACSRPTSARWCHMPGMCSTPVRC